MAQSSPESPQRIGIAIVEYRGHYLVGQRAADSPLAGLAEFPGGKCRPGETTGVCAQRECLEESGLRVRVIELLMQRIFTYDHGSFDLHFWLCHPQEPVETAARQQNFRWVPRSELEGLNFPEGNRPVIEVLLRK